jgi:hypothetical protein
VTAPVAINASGEIAGQYFNGQTFEGFVRKADGAITTFSPKAGDITYVTGINADRTIIGYFSGTNADSPVHGFVRLADGAIIKFHVPGSTQTVPESIDPEGEITGYYLKVEGTNEYAGFVRSCDGAITTFDVPGSIQIMPVTINAQALSRWYLT